MKAYLSVIRDRHLDPKHIIFQDRQEAIDYTRKEFTRLMRDEDAVEEFFIPDSNDYIVWFNYKYGEDDAYVTRIDVAL